MARFEANVAAIRVSQQLAVEGRAATAAEHAVLARYSSWGAVPQVFDESKPEWAERRAELRSVLSEREYDAARRTTINAHYTSPQYVGAIWAALEQLGFDGGRVLEPGSGLGTFIGLAPQNANMVGVELDPTTAAISRALYPHADIRTESFADTKVPEGTFDATVGNVPFADVSLHDPVHNPDGHSMHNHFILKSLALTRPGGMVAVLTSSFTLDARNSAAREAMSASADLVGAVRLPSGAHRATAGTDAVTDLLILRKREADEPPLDRSWETVVAQEVDGGTVHLNSYFVAHPEQVLGQLQVGRSLYGADRMMVHTHDLAGIGGQLQNALGRVVDEAHLRDLRFTERAGDVPELAAPELTNLWDGTIVERDGEFQIARDGVFEPFPVAVKRVDEVRELLALRDGARELLAMEHRQAEDTSELREARAQLRKQYHAYVDEYGPINRFTLQRTGHYEPLMDEITGEPVLDADGKQVPDHDSPRMSRRTPPAMARFRHDPYAPLVMALEQFDDQTQEARPAQILLERVVAPRQIAEVADTPAEALALSLDRVGRVDVDVVAELLNVEPDQARTALTGLVYENPATGELETEPEYLSGDVRTKLDVAREAALTDDRFAAHVAALERVQPEDIPIEHIEARLGAVWISPEIHQEFLRELLQDRNVIVENPLPGKWYVRGGTWGTRATEEWGTERRPAGKIAQAAMEQRPILVEDKEQQPDGSTKMVTNTVETVAAQEKVEAMQNRFTEWVWEKPERAQALHAQYNRQFNSIALRDYSTAGDYLSLPGLSETYTLAPHQRAAVARMIAEPTVGLFHQVGAGKTLEMIVGATELKRMGMINKPLFVVPNHMLEQFTREWLHAYPSAMILAAGSKDVSVAKRQAFIARAAMNEWDGVIMTQEAFKLIALSPDFEREYLERQVDELRASLEAATGENRWSVKSIEKAVLNMENRLTTLLDKDTDDGLTFESMGVDYLVVDEAHQYKNLQTKSNISDASITGSQAATDLHMKLEYLRSQNGERVATLATATPLANSITEAHVMQRYLRPDLLEQSGCTSFDGWAATFGATVTELEIGPAGGFRQKTRFARFQNVPEMMRMWHTFADVKTSADLKLPTPDIAPRRTDGEREVETVVIQPTPELETYIDDIAKRAEKVGRGDVARSEDNMLLISTDGRKAALDMRLIDPAIAPTALTKLDAVAERVLEHWEANRDNVYVDGRTGEESPVRGSLQLVFSDLGTPNPDRWDAYTELKAKLVEGGIPSDKVRFMHEAKNDQEKATLFSAARSGHVSVLIGSTLKMGVGTNVQDRITALHHVDCPWRPADIEQREGRAIRRHNQNSEVSLFRYVVEGSFDAYSWQTVARKAVFINQVMTGRIDSREIEDIGGMALSAGAAKAAASGDPLVLEHAELDAAYQKLRRAELAYHRAQASLGLTVSSKGGLVAVLEEERGQLQAAIPRTQSVAGDAFRITIGEQVYTSRSDAAQALGMWAITHIREWKRNREDGVQLGELAGHDLMIKRGEDRQTTDWRLEPTAEIWLRDVPRSSARLTESELVEATVGTIRTLENRTTNMAVNLGRVESELHSARVELAAAEERYGQPFAKADELAETKRALDDVTRRVRAGRAERNAPAGRDVPAPTADERRAALAGDAVAPPMTGAALKQQLEGAASRGGRGPVEPPTTPQRGPRL